MHNYQVLLAGMIDEFSFGGNILLAFVLVSSRDSTGGPEMELSNIKQIIVCCQDAKTVKLKLQFFPKSHHVLDSMVWIL